MKKITLITAALIIATNLAFSQGTAINDNGAAGDNSAMLDVSSTTKGILVPRMTAAEKNGITSPATGLLIYQTDFSAGFWYYNGTMWVQSTGPAGATGAQGITGVTGATGNTGTSGSGGHYVGELYGGGVVFCVENGGSNGLIYSMILNSSTYSWSDNQNQVPAPGAKSSWDGQTNTTATVNQTTNSAAYICDSYTNSDYGTGTFSDWYLPAFDQLHRIYNTRYEINKAVDSDGDPSTVTISGVYYWSSTEKGTYDAYYISFNDGMKKDANKADAYNIRCIRSF